MNIGTQLLELFLVGYAKPLFFIDDDQTEILEFGLFGENCMGANDEVDVARFQGEIPARRG